MFLLLSLYGCCEVCLLIAHSYFAHLVSSSGVPFWLWLAYKTVRFQLFGIRRVALMIVESPFLPQA